MLILLALWQYGCGVEPATEEQQAALPPVMAVPAPPTSTQPPAPSPTLTHTPSSTKTEGPPKPTATPPPPTPTRTATEVQMIQVDIASLPQFPDLKYTFSGTLPGASPEVVLMDGESLAGAATHTEGLWAATVPASFEVTVPPLGEAFLMTRIEVTDPGGDKALHECEVSLQLPGKPGWQPVLGVMGLRMQQGPGMKAEEGKSIFAFKPIRAIAVRIEFQKGGEGTPDRVFVTDIDIFGTAPKGSLP